jgi:hypothetical protein
MSAFNADANQHIEAQSCQYEATCVHGTLGEASRAERTGGPLGFDGRKQCWLPHGSAPNRQDTLPGRGAAQNVSTPSTRERRPRIHWKPWKNVVADMRPRYSACGIETQFAPSVRFFATLDRALQCDGELLRLGHDLAIAAVNRLAARLQARVPVDS